MTCSQSPPPPSRAGPGAAEIIAFSEARRKSRMASGSVGCYTFSTLRRLLAKAPQRDGKHHIEPNNAAGALGVMNKSHQLHATELNYSML